MPRQQCQPHSSRVLQSLRSHVAAVAAPPPQQQEAESVITMEEVRRHGSRSSCWIALMGGVYDFTEFAAGHPGGARGLLRYAGADASDVFAELHSQSIFGEFGPRYRIGRLAGVPAQDGWAGVSPSTRFWEGLPADEPIDPALPSLLSPFPHQRFDSTGLETFRFNVSSTVCPLFLPPSPHPALSPPLLQPLKIYQHDHLAHVRVPLTEWFSDRLPHSGLRPTGSSGLTETAP